MENLDDTRSSHICHSDQSIDDKMEEETGVKTNYRNSYTIMEGNADKNSLLGLKLNMSLVPILKTKGIIHFKKKGPFNKWKEYLVFLDESNLQLNFYKKENDQTTLNTCKMSIDLRFVERIIPTKRGILCKKSCFKIYRRAGLSTVQLATYSDEDRAEWITTLEMLIKKIETSPGMTYIKAATLPQRQSLCTFGNESDSDKSIHTSASEELQIRPRKVSKSGFQINSAQISNIKLKRTSSEVSGNLDKERKHEKTTTDKAESPNAFGIHLKKVDQEEIKTHKVKESTNEETEFHIKYNSLTKPRRSPNLPLSEKVQNAVGDKEKACTLLSPSPRSSPGKADIRKKSHVSSIPLSKSVQSVIQNNPDLETTIKQSKIQVDIDTCSETSETRICHAVTTEIPKFECELGELNGNKLNPPEISKSVSELTNNEEISKEEVITNTNLKNDVTESSILNKTKQISRSNPKYLVSSIEVTLLKTKSPQKPPRSYSFDTKNSHNKLKKVMSYSGTTELQQRIQAQQVIIKENLSNDNDYSNKCSHLNSLGKSISHTDVVISVEENIKECLMEVSTEALPQRNKMVLESSLINTLNSANNKSNEISLHENDEEKEISDNIMPKFSNSCEIDVNLSSPNVEDNTTSIIGNDIVIPSINNSPNECFDEIFPETIINSDENFESKTENNSTNSPIEMKEDNMNIHLYNTSENMKLPENKFFTGEKIKNDIKVPMNIETRHEINVQISVTPSEETIVEVPEEMNSPVEIRKNYLTKSLMDEEMETKRPSTLSILSSESDDPLPKFYFTGKSDRASCNSSFFREQLSIDEEVIKEEKNFSSEMEELKAKIATCNITDTDEIGNNYSTENNVSLNLEANSDTYISNTENNRTFNRENENQCNHTVDKIIDVEYDDLIEEVDYFPTKEETDKKMLYIEESPPIRTSGICGLNEYFLSIDEYEKTTETISGVNRLGVSVAVEKLKNELCKE